MQSPRATVDNTGKFATLMIFGGIALAVFMFFMDTRVDGSEQTTSNRVSADIADIENAAKSAQNSLAGLTSEGQIGQQLANLQARFSGGSAPPEIPTPVSPTVDQPANTMPVIVPISEVVYPTATPIPPPPPTQPPPPTPVPFDLNSAATYHTAVLGDGRKHIMTSQRIYMACTDMFLQYAGVVAMQAGYPLFDWFMALSRSEREVYYYQCNQ
jgi:hypothetical protein